MFGRIGVGGNAGESTMCSLLVAPVWPGTPSASFHLRVKNQISPALFIAKVSLPSQSPIFIQPVTALFPVLRVISLHDILWYIDFRFHFFSLRTFFSFHLFETNCDSDEWKQDEAGNCYWIWSLFKMWYPKKLSQSVGRTAHRTQLRFATRVTQTIVWTSARNRGLSK